MDSRFAQERKWVIFVSLWNRWTNIVSNDYIYECQRCACIGVLCAPFYMPLQNVQMDAFNGQPFSLPFELHITNFNRLLFLDFRLMTMFLVQVDKIIVFENFESILENNIFPRYIKQNRIEFHCLTNLFWMLSMPQRQWPYSCRCDTIICVIFHVIVCELCRS